jgi:YVTN family beta-propeller protein
MPIALASPQTPVFNPANGDIYVANSGDGSIAVISDQTNRFVAIICVGSSPFAPIYDPSNEELYVSNEGGRTVSVVSALSVVATVPVGDDPRPAAFDSQNGDVYVPNYGSDFMSVISGATNTVAANITVGKGVGGAVFDPANGDLYLTSNQQGAVLIVDGATNSLIANITLDFAICNGPCTRFQDNPWPPVFDPANGDVYVSNAGGDTVSVISGATNSIVANVVVGNDPLTPAIDSANGISTSPTSRRIPYRSYRGKRIPRLRL